MSEKPEAKVTREGLFEEILGKAKEATGELIGNEHMAEAGREQQTEAEAGSDEGSASPDQGS